jgi:hypothetical protein
MLLVGLKGGEGGWERERGVSVGRKEGGREGRRDGTMGGMAQAG